MRVIEGRCAPYGKNIPLLPILQIFRHYYGITEQDSDRSAREKLAGHLLLLDEGYREVLPVLFEFLSTEVRAELDLARFASAANTPGMR